MGGLEDRVRHLILGNDEREATPPLQGASPHVSRQPPIPMGMSPFAQQGLESVRPAQENFSPGDQASPPAFPKGGKKRPNQAQRRQMSAQLSIPIDTRPQMPQSARAYVSPPAYPPHQQQYSHGGQNRVQRPHSATFRPPSRGNPAPGPMTGNPFPPNTRHHPSLSYHGPMSSPGEWQSHPPNGDPRSFHGPPTLFDPSSPRTSRHGPSGSYGSNKLYHTRPEELRAQTDLLEGLCATVIAGAEIEPDDILEKEMFRAKIEEVARSAIAQYERETNGFHNFPPGSVQLKCFGSLSSGFATKAADMDLGLLSPLSVTAPDAPGSPIPRLLEKAFLEIGLGARLLTRTRVPIIKICQNPPEKLRLDLLAEREKWEKGLPDEVDDEDTHEEDPHEADDIQPHDYRHHDLGVSAGTVGSSKPERKFRSLRQGDKMNLAAYYRMAKGLLRKLGGRDYTHSNAIELKEDDLVFLNEFALAFVDGLADDTLRQRLLSYSSLNRHGLTVGRKYRTLLSVYTQIEGEMMALVWESRKIPEKDKIAEQQAQNIVRSWTILGNKPTFNNDPIGYSKELQFALDQLKRISSIQLMILAQSQHESAALYHTRATRFMLELGIHDIPGEHRLELHFVVSQYIKGIATDQVRQEVQEFADSCPRDTITLRAVARRHKSLQLAYEFERCLEKGLYPEASTAAAVEQYVKALRTPMINFSLPFPQFDLVVPLPTEAAGLMPQIRQLGDPAQLSPNQPRDPYRDRLEFPKSGVGVQCDVNFSAHLALQNTLLLRCYSHTDPRVRPLVLFVKHWAKVRQINTPYRGTLSSYGYVLMMLHYLVNIAQPFVCPNLQLLAQPPDPKLTPEEIEETVSCKGKNVQFWRDEATIQRLARENALNQNQDSLGHLLRGFFEYYAQSNQMSTVQSRGFDWGRDVLSLRTPGGLLSKQEKGWTGAKTVVEVKSMAASVTPVSPEQTATFPTQGNQHTVSDLTAAPTQASHGRAPSQTTREIKEVRHRYLFAIEDPFELDHNVARTVTHNGIVAIRDEFRRAWRILKDAGRGIHQENLLLDVAAAYGDRDKKEFSQLLDEIHGPVAEQLGL